MTVLKSLFFVALTTVFGVSSTVRAQAPDMASLNQLPDMIELTDSDVSGFIEMAEKLKALGFEFDDEQIAGEPSALESAMASQEAKDILRSAGLDSDRLGQISYSIALAYASVTQSPEEAAEMKAGMAQMAEMEQMKDSIPAAQWEMMQDSMGSIFRMMEQFANQPAGNLALAKRYANQLDDLFDGGR